MLPETDEITDPFLAAKAIIESFPADKKWQAHEVNFDDFMALIDDVIAEKADPGKLFDPKYNAYNFVFLTNITSGTAPSEDELTENKTLLLQMQKEGALESKVFFTKEGELPLNIQPEILPLAVTIAQRTFNLAYATENDSQFECDVTEKGLIFTAANRYPDKREQAIQKLEDVRHEMASMFARMEKGKGYEVAVPPLPRKSAYSRLDADLHSAFGLEDNDVEDYQQHRDKRGKQVHCRQRIDDEAEFIERVDNGELTLYYQVVTPKDMAWVERYFLKKVRGKEMQL